jgi:hypothetical protein
MRATKRQICWILTGIVFFITAAHAYSQTAPFTIRVSSSAETVSSGEDITLTIQLENTSDRILYWRPGPLPGYNVSVEDEASRAVEMTDLGKRESGLDPNHPLGMINTGKKGWLPGKIRTYTFKVNEWYNVSKPGIYKITVSAWDLEKRQKVYASPVIITVK